MGGLKGDGSIGAHITPTRTVALTRERQCVIFAFVIDTYLQLDARWSRGDWLPKLFHSKTVI